MKPQLSEKERNALLILGKKPVQDLDHFEIHIRSEIGRLSMDIDSGTTNVDRMKTDLEEAEQDLNQKIGAFEATARTHLAYLGTRGQTPNAPSVPAEVPEAASIESEAPKDTPTPSESETPQEGADLPRDDPKEPEPEAD